LMAVHFHLHKYVKYILANVDSSY